MKKIIIVAILLIAIQTVCLNAIAVTYVGQWNNVSELLEKMSTNDDVTVGESNALNKAFEYLDYTPFSHKGLIEQLEYEGYSYSEAKYGADNCEANWNEQALRHGRIYMEYSSFSYAGLLDQLIYEGYTNSEAKYACDVIYGYREEKDSDGLPIEKGDRGEQVSSIQSRLNELGYSAGTVDGIFGEGTMSAIKQFQTDNNIETTGVIDEETYEALFEEVKEENLNENSEESSSGSIDVQQKFMDDLLFALKARKIQGDIAFLSHDDVATAFREVVEIEYDLLEKYENVQFVDEFFNTLAHRYLDGCKLQIEGTFDDEDYITFVSLWNAGLCIRSGVILEMIDLYNLSVPEHFLEYFNDEIGSSELRLY